MFDELKQEYINDQYALLYAAVQKGVDIIGGLQAC